MKRKLISYALPALFGLVVLVLLGLGITYSAGFLSAPAPEPQEYEGTPLNKPAPGFELTDQNGHTLALSDLEGRVVVLTFLDSQCSDICPLTALHLRLAYERLRYLGADVSKLVLLGINVNLAGNTLEDARAFTARYGLSAVPTWHFLIGPEAALRAVWQAYGVTVQTENVSLEAGAVESSGAEGHAQEGGHVVHSTGIYLIDPHGRLRWYLSTQLGEAGQLRATLEGLTPSDWLVARLRPMLPSLSSNSDGGGEGVEEGHTSHEEGER